MQIKFRFTLTLATVLTVLAFSATWTAPAFADDSTPPPMENPTEVTPPAEEPAAPVDQPAEGAEIVVLDSSGETVPLATQEAADIIVEGDPTWCPVGVAPGGAGCSPMYANFGTVPGISLLDWLQTNDPAKAGVIWIASDYDNLNLDPATDITLNGGATFLDNMNDFALTINGGWSGLSGSKVIDQSAPSIIDVSFSIFNWNAAVTINDIVITGVPVNPNNTSSLYVQTAKGGITLNRVQVIDNFIGGQAGARLSTTSAPLGKPAAIIVNDSTFNYNRGSGLVIASDGAVTIRNLTTNYNGTSGVTTDYGTFIDNYFENPDMPVTFTGTNEFKGNLGTGLAIYSFGAVSLNNITAYANDDTSDDGTGDGNGVIIDNTFGVTPTPSIVKLTGTNLFNNNQEDGLVIRANGNILLNNITSLYNGQGGLTGGGTILNNCLNTGPDTVCTTVGKSVTLTGVNTFNGNYDDGLIVFSSGAIILSQITANDNGADGAYLDNCAYDSVTLFTCLTPLPYAVTLKGPSTFNQNYSGTGLYIVTTGAVSLKNTTANYNNSGALIFNHYKLLKPQNVTLGGTNTFNGNWFSGLEVITYGSITASGITANDNGASGTYGYGASLDNLGFYIGGSVLVTRKPITLSGTNTFNSNYDAGLAVYSAGVILVNNVTANNNAGDGMDLYNSYDWYPNYGLLTKYAANVTVNGFGTFEGNFEDGAEIYSHGAVTLKNVNANNNFSGNGLYIQNGGYSAPQSVTISGVNNFNGNTGGDGLYIYTDGKITLSSVTALFNAGNGAYLDNYTNSWANKFLGITLTGFNTFQDNGAHGLYLDTDGSAVVNHINTDNNSSKGAYIQATKNLTIMCGNAFSNTGTGFDLYSGATMTLKGVRGIYNGLNENLGFFVTLIRTPYCP